MTDSSVWTSLVSLVQLYVNKEWKFSTESYFGKPDAVSYYYWLTKSDVNVAKLYQRGIERVVDEVILPQETADNHGAYNDDVMQEVQMGSTNHLKFLKMLLSNLWEGSQEANTESEEEELQALLKTTITKSAASVVVALSFHSECHPWTNASARAEATALIDVLLKISSHKSLSTLVGGCHLDKHEANTTPALFPEGLANQIFEILKKRLNKECWKRDPASRHAFSWCLKQIEHPYLGQHLQLALPATLLFVDNYQPSDKLLGVKSLLHIIDNVDPTELRWYGRIEVIYEALHPMLYQQDADLLAELIPCLLKVLAITEKKQESTLRKPNRYDTVFQVILTNMDSEQKIGLRQVYAEFVEGFIQVMGITVLRHMKRLMRVLTNYLEESDGNEEISRKYTLLSLKALIINAWPRIPSHATVLLKSLLRLLYDMSVIDSFNISMDAKQVLVEHAEECLFLLQKCCGSAVVEAIEGICTTSVPNQFLKSSLERVLNGR